MKNKDFSIRFELTESPEKVFTSVNNVRDWWSQHLEGNSIGINNEFIYRHGSIHYSRHRIIEQVPFQKVVWLTIDSELSFAEIPNEWNGSLVIFEIYTAEDKTVLSVTHSGLTPALQCYENCSKGWTYYLQESLVPLIRNGKGNPDQ